MTAPLTWKKLGSTRCVHCEKRFTETPDLRVIEREATDYTGGRKFYSANRPVQVMRRWHSECLKEFEAANAAYRWQVEADNLRVVEELRQQVKP